MGFVPLSDSKSICRLCGKDNQESTNLSIFDCPSHPSLPEDISFFLPIQVNLTIYIANVLLLFFMPVKIFTNF